MKKLTVFTLGLVFGILLFGLAGYTRSVETTAPEAVIVEQGTIEQEEAQVPDNSKVIYERYWQANGFKFKDIGRTDSEKTYVWDVPTKQWLDTGCTNYLTQTDSKSNERTTLPLGR